MEFLEVPEMFNEKEEEWSSKQNKNIPVWLNPKYIEARDKAIELINGKKYDLQEGDFWILMNETKTGKMGYSGLIISHNGCLKINDKLENKVNPKCFSVEKDGYKKSLVYTYCDDDVYEVGEVSETNCKNEYPYAMAFKRCFDRAVLKKCKLAYAGVYSDSEADEFTKKDENNIEDTTENLITETQEKALRNLIKNKSIETSNILTILNKYNYKKLAEIKLKNYINIVEEIDNL